jgi:acyl-CoA synthetase (AMP-forming)/AMP-acid ligase II
MNAVLTSGSTGFSKLVPQTRGQVFANAEALARRLQLRSGDRILTPLPLYHVNALNFSLLTSAMVGAEAHFTHALPLRSFLSTIAEVRPRFVSLIPPLLRQLQSCSEIELRAALRDTEALITAATALSPELYEFVVRKLGLRLLQGYGLSESVNFSCLMELHPQRPAEDFLSEITVEGESVSAAQRYVSIGSALEGTEVSIRDQEDRAVPEGQVGEICVRGFSTMNGYWNVKPEDQPIRSEWLRTGDLGFEKIPRDGPSIFFHAGRIKEVMKRSGETISLIEVDFKINRALATETGHQLRQQLESLGFLDFMAVGFSHSITGEELALVVRVDPRQVGELGREPWSEKSQSEWAKVFSALDVKFRPRVLLYVAEDFRTASGKPQRWKPKVELAPARDQIMTAVPLVLWSSSLTGAD